MTANNKLHQAFLEFQKNGIDCFYVGGCVRDRYFGIQSDDIDICLVGVVDYKLVSEILLNCADKIAPAVGEFPVWIADFDGEKIDFALARKETKEGDTRQDFLTETFGVTIEQDLLRRDLTINAIAINCITNAIVDPYNGIEHIKNRIAHPVSKAFAEDPLRVYRAGRFIARFDLFASEQLVELCKEIPHIISNERIGSELHKVFKQSDKPSQFFQFLKRVDWLKYHFSFLNDKNFIYFREAMWPLDRCNNTFQCIVALCYKNGEIKDCISFLESISFLDGTFRKQVAVVLALLYSERSLYTNENIAQAKRKIVKHDILEEDFFFLLKFFCGDKFIKLDRIWPDIIVEPIITGKILLDYGIKEGPEIGLLMKKALSLQDQGLLYKNNWEETLTNKILNND